MAEISNKTSILAAAMILITLATSGLERGVDYSNLIEFGFGLILIAIYHFWFGGNGDGKLQK